MLDNIPFFTQIVITPEERARYDRNVTSFLCDAVTEYSSSSHHTNEDAWIHVRRRKQLSIYKSVYGTCDPHVTLFKGTGLVQGPVQDVMDGLYCDTTEGLRACKTLLKYKLVDGSIMNVTEQRSPDAPYRFAGIKWFAARAAWGLVKHRDVLAYERMGTTTDANGNELAFHVLHSIDHPDWPLDAIKGMKREHQVTCFLYRSYRDSQVECFIWSTVYNLDSVAPRLAEYVVAGTLLRVTECVKSAHAKKFSMLMKNAQHSKWPVSSLCHICYGRSFMSTNRPCAGCFQSVCKSCSDYRFIFHIDAQTGRPHQQRFCKLCINSTETIDSQSFEASIKRERRENADTGEVSRQNVIKSPVKANQTSHSVVDTSLRSNYLDWASDWSSQDDDDDEYICERAAASRNRSKSKSKDKTSRSDKVSLSDLDSEDKFSPYPSTPQSYKQQTEGRNKSVQENRVQKKRGTPTYLESSQQYQSPVDQYTAQSRHHQQRQEPLSRHAKNGQQTQLPPFRSPYQPSEPKKPSSFSVIPNDSDDGSEVALMENGLGLSKFDLGVVKTSFTDSDSLALSMYSDDDDLPHRRRGPRYGRSSHADKDGFLSDLYSMSRSRIHGQHY
ncbi:unnamed protein product [Peronospora destructor]|uniref:START-like domain n=1 Tax=Peronospora destructor TaxID=86335 RepID=A0AAV0UTN6_9STRA|nr:unnamed protein product [Peronospora destructor]